MGRQESIEIEPIGIAELAGVAVAGVEHREHEAAFLDQGAADRDVAFGPPDQAEDRTVEADQFIHRGLGDAVMSGDPRATAWRGEDAIERVADQVGAGFVPATIMS